MKLKTKYIMQIINDIDSMLYKLIDRNHNNWSKIVHLKLRAFLLLLDLVLAGLVNIPIPEQLQDQRSISSCWYTISEDDNEISCLLDRSENSGNTATK